MSLQYTLHVLPPCGEVCDTAYQFSLLELTFQNDQILF